MPEGYKPASIESELAAAKREIGQLKAQTAKLSADLRRVQNERIEYLQNVSHQLVAPLNAMKWHIENLTSARIGVDRAKKVLRSVYSQATIAVHLAKNFALMSNLDADHQLTALQEGLEPVDLKRLMINLADDFQPLGWDRHVHVEVDDSSFFQVPAVLAIKALISQVFGNVIENAIKYSFDNTQVIIAGSYSKTAGMVTVNISNRGIGVAQSDVGSIFERGYRSSDARNRYPAGTGFGLYIAKKITDLHEGEISVRREGELTVFSVALYVDRLEGKARQWPTKQYS